MTPERVKVRFPSGDTECSAWHYPGTNGACVIMAGGFAVTKEPGTDLFGSIFRDAGFSVLAFDYRRIGESGGEPRQVLPIRDQLADWDAAISCAGELPDVDPHRLAVWGFSASGGHVLLVAARNPAVAAAIAQTPNASGRAAAQNAARHQRLPALMRLSGRGFLDVVGGLFGLAPRLVPLAGEPGHVAVVTTPDALDGDRALNPDNRYPDWQQAVAARSALRLGFYEPGRAAQRISCPLLVVVCDNDQTALVRPGLRVAERAPRAELVRLPGGHYAPFLDAHDAAAEAEVSFLRRHLAGRTSSSQDLGSAPGPSRGSVVTRPRAAETASAPDEGLQPARTVERNGDASQMRTAAGRSESPLPRAHGRPRTPLRRLLLGAMVLVLVQAGIGMSVNLYVVLPSRHPGAHPGSYLRGSLDSVSWAIVHGSLALGAHVMLGLALVVVMALLAFYAIRSGGRVVAAWSSLGGLLVIGAAFNGASFLDFNDNVSSLIMALLAFASIGCYAAALFGCPA